MNCRPISSIVCVGALCLAACANSTLRIADAACSTRGSSVDKYMPVAIDDMKMLLPLNSKLVAENTIDARHWAWSTDVGHVSVSWISRIGRESRLKARTGDSCTINAGGVTFFVEMIGVRLTAVSDPVYDSGAGVLVIIDGIRSMEQKINGYGIIESIRIATSKTEPAG